VTTLAARLDDAAGADAPRQLAQLRKRTLQIVDAALDRPRR